MDYDGDCGVGWFGLILFVYLLLLFRLFIYLTEEKTREWVANAIKLDKVCVDACALLARINAELMSR